MVVVVVVGGVAAENKGSGNARFVAKKTRRRAVLRCLESKQRLLKRYARYATAASQRTVMQGARGSVTVLHSTTSKRHSRNFASRYSGHDKKGSSHRTSVRRNGIT